MADEEAEEVEDVDGDPEADPLSVAVVAAVAEEVGQEVELSEKLVEGDQLNVTVQLPDVVADALTVGRAVPVFVLLEEELAAPLAVVVGVPAAVEVLVGEAVVEELARADPEELLEPAGLSVSVKLPVELSEGGSDGDAVAVAVAVAEEEGESEGVAEGVEEALLTAEGVTVAVLRAVADAKDDGVLEPDPVPAALIVQHPVDVGEAVPDTVSVEEAVMDTEEKVVIVALKLCVTHGEAEELSEKVGDPCSVTVGGGLTEIVPVATAVPDAGALAVEVIVINGEGEKVMVGTAFVGVRMEDSELSKDAELSRVAEVVEEIEGVAEVVAVTEKLPDVEGVTERDKEEDGGAVQRGARDVRR